MAAPKAYVSWSSGKDSAMALWVAKCSGLIEVAGILTTTSEAYERVAIHGVREQLLTRQAAALGLPLHTVALPTPCSHELYEAKIKGAYAALFASGVRQIVFGDLFLEDLRDHRIKTLALVGMQAVFPLWKRNTHNLAREIISSGIIAHISCVDPRRLDRSFAGRQYDETLLRDLPSDVDPCGENGEFHTVVSVGPMFGAAIKVSIGEIVERDGCVFADVIPT